MCVCAEDKSNVNKTEEEEQKSREQIGDWMGSHYAAAAAWLPFAARTHTHTHAKRCSTRIDGCSGKRREREGNSEDALFKFWPVCLSCSPFIFKGREENAAQFFLLNFAVAAIKVWWWLDSVVGMKTERKGIEIGWTVRSEKALLALLQGNTSPKFSH